MRRALCGGIFLLTVSAFAACSSFSESDEAVDGGTSDGGPDDAVANVDAAADGVTGPDGIAPRGDGGPCSAAGLAGDAATPMVLVEAAAGAFCIETAEVTNAQYQTFVTASASFDAGLAAVARCAGANDRLPGSCALRPAPDPVRCVSWCDAYAYCKWAGRRLCGKIGGGPSSAVFEKTNQDEWFVACTSDLTRDYPYGATYDALACNTRDRDAGKPLAPGSSPNCVTTIPSLFDLSGNLNEWVDNCTETYCALRGGDYMSAPANARCDEGHGSPPQNKAGATTGFRCCADP